MSISSQRSLAQLQKECEDNGIKVVQSGNRVTKTDYILALRDFYMKKNFPNGIPKSLELMLQIESPMLCQRYTVLNDSEKKSIWDSKDWVAEQKEDGARMVMIWTGGEWDFFSRNISVSDFLPVNYKDHFYMGDADFSGITDEFILDSEVMSTNPRVSTIIGKRGVVTESQLQAVTALMTMNLEDSINIQKNEGCPLEFRTFDCLWYNGEWLIDKPLIERMPYLIKALEQIQKAGMKARRPYSNYTNKKAFYKALVASGAEGVILKNLKSPYIASNARRRDGFVKVKRTMSEAREMSGLGDTIDAFVTGFEPADETKGFAGMVGCLEFSCYLRDAQGNTKPHMIARVSNIPLDLRKEITDHDENGNPILAKSVYGRCCEIDGQCVTARSLRLKHAVLVKWRPDRTPDTCILDEDFLMSMIL